MVKPINTEYAGYNFRSRLEARWAVFFSSVGFEWEYEPEGFELQSGRYLPDFFIRNLGGGTWVEVKRRDYKLTHAERAKIEELCQHTGKDALVLDGIPDLIAYEHYTSDSQMHDGDWVWSTISEKHWPHDGRLYVNTSACGIEGRHCSMAGFEGAINRAKRARFEFGETPG